jgi:hypothetical protein
MWRVDGRKACGLTRGDLANCKRGDILTLATHAVIREGFVRSQQRP